MLNHQLGQSQYLSSVLPAFNVSDEGATHYEANLCLLLEWTEGTAREKKIRKPYMGAGEQEWI